VTLSLQGGGGGEKAVTARNDVVNPAGTSTWFFPREDAFEIV